MAFVVYLCIILASVAQSVCAKHFNRQGERQSGQSMVFNAVKSLSALLLFALMALPRFQLHLPTVLFGLLYGLSLCLSMYAGYRALCLGPMALTSMLVSFSVLLPLVWGLTVRKEPFSALQAVALIFLLCAVVTANADRLRVRAQTETSYGKWLAFVALTFLCNGACSILQAEYGKVCPETYNREFMVFAMLLCSAVFTVAALIRVRPRDFKQIRGKRYGVLAGLTNAVANFLTLLLAGLENASILFPIISAGTILVSLLCGRLFFHEKLKVNHYISLGSGIVALILLKL